MEVVTRYLPENIWPETLLLMRPGPSGIKATHPRQVESRYGAYKETRTFHVPFIRGHDFRDW